MITVSIYLKVNNLSENKLGKEHEYIELSLDFDTSIEPFGLKNIMDLPEMIKESWASMLCISPNNIDIISRNKYYDALGIDY